MTPAPSRSALANLLPWHGQAVGLRRRWRAQRLPRATSAWSTFALGSLAFAFGMIGFLDANAKGVANNNFGQSLYATISLYTLSFAVPNGAQPGLILWIAVFAAPLTTARVLFQLLRDRISGLVVRRLLRGHVIVCGAGFRGAFIAERLAADGELVVLIDSNDQAPGLVEARLNDVFPLVGDATSPEVLRRAGAARAKRLVAIAGDDYRNASIAAAAAQVPGRTPEIFVHVDDPAVARVVDAPLRSGQAAPIPFSTTTRAAAAAIDRADEAALDRPPLPDHRFSIVLFGDGPMIDAMLLELHRRWQIALLGGADRSFRPRVALFAPNASSRLRVLRAAHGDPLDEIDIVATDIDPDFDAKLDAESERALRDCLPVDDVWVIDKQPVAALRMALTVSRVIGSRFKVRLLSLGSVDELTQAVETQTIDNDEVADILPECLVELAFGESTLDDSRRAARLAHAAGLDLAADPVTREAAIRDAEAHLANAGAVVDEPAPVASQWHAGVHDALGVPEPSVFIRARLRIDHLAARTVRRAGPELIRRAVSAADDAARAAAEAAAFTYYGRVAGAISDPESVRWEWLLEDVAESTDQEHHLKQDIVLLLELRRKALRLAGSAERGGSVGAKPAGSNGTTPAESGDAAARTTTPAAYAFIVGGDASWNPDDAASPARAAAAVLAEAVGRPDLDATLITTAATGGAAAIVDFVGTRTHIHTRGLEVGRSPAPTHPLADPLRAWGALLKAGVQPAHVPVVAYPGDRLTTQEVALAQALGAPVALVDLGPQTAASTAQFSDDVNDRAADVNLVDNTPDALRAFLQRATH